MVKLCRACFGEMSEMFIVKFAFKSDVRTHVEAEGVDRLGYFVVA